MKKKALTLVGVFALIGVLISIIYFMMVSGLFACFMSSPEKPEISSAEFTFELQWEMDGAIQTVKDTAIVEFDGFSDWSSAGRERQWKIYTKNSGLVSNDEEALMIVIKDFSSEKVYDEYGNQIISLYFYGGSAQYFMSDELGGNIRTPQNLDEVMYCYKKQDGEIWHSYLDETKAYEMFGLRLISWECEPPIEIEYED